MEKKVETNSHVKELLEAMKTASCRSVLACPHDDELGKKKLEEKCFSLKLVAFIRHGQGEHNIASQEQGQHIYLLPEYKDALLTKVGHEQASSLKPLTDTLSIETVFVSPMQRTLQTASNAFSHATPFIAVEECREQYGRHYCDQRGEILEKKKEFGWVDFAGLVNEDVLWTPERETKKNVISRADIVLNDHVLKRGGDRVALVTHSSFLLTTFHAVLDFSHATSDNTDDFLRWFRPGELRLFYVGTKKE